MALAQAGASPADDEPDAARVTAMAGKLDAGQVQVMYQVAILGRRDLALAPDEFAGFSMALLRMLSFAPASGEARPARAPAPVARPEARPATSSIASAPRVAPVAAAAPSPALVSAPIEFDGDWQGWVERVNLTGMAGMVARHGELASFQNGSFELVVPESHRMYAEKAYQDKLKAELHRHFGPNARLAVRVGSTSGVSVAAKSSKEMAQRQANAAEAIEDDPFVRDLVRDFGAEVVTSSIRPAEEPSAGSTKEKR